MLQTFQLTCGHQRTYIRLLFKCLPSIIKEAHLNANLIELKVTKENLEVLLRSLQHNTLSQLEQLSDIAPVDNFGKLYRFKLNFLMFSFKYSTRLTISLKTHEFQGVSSITYLFNSAKWLEREAGDLFGIKFHGNTDLRRILTDYGFKGHALQKNFPLSGFTELNYNDLVKRIIGYEIQLFQTYRNFKL